MSIDVWQNLPKAQDNPETIEEAIDRKITDHLHDTAAHLGADESLQSHRASEIIDHLASSIVTDKVQEYQITQDKLAYTAAMYETNFSDFALWNKATSGGTITQYMGGVYLYASTTPNTWAAIQANSLLHQVQLGERMAILEWVADVEFDFSQYIIEMGIGYYILPHVGFRLVDNVMYAYHKAFGGAVTQQEIVGFTVLGTHIYKLVTQPDGTVYFYIDNILVATLTGLSYTNIGYLAGFYVKTTTTDDQSLRVKQLRFIH